MRSIHSHTAKMTESIPNVEKKSSDAKSTIQMDDKYNICFKNSLLSPPILIVGTNKNNISNHILNKEDFIQEKLTKIKNFVSNKIYFPHIVEPYLTIDGPEKNDSSTKNQNNLEKRKNELVNKTNNIKLLKKLIENVALNEPYMGEQQPIKWMKFEKCLEKLKSKNLFYASLSQVCFFFHLN